MMKNADGCIVPSKATSNLSRKGKESFDNGTDFGCSFGLLARWAAAVSEFLIKID
jgi:hypothetical protein